VLYEDGTETGHEERGKDEAARDKMRRNTWPSSTQTACTTRDRHRGESGLMLRHYAVRFIF
jgi:hypothetical protein